MADILLTWVPEFSVLVIAQDVAPVIAGGFALGGMFWLVGYLVDALFAVMRGGFYWTR